MANSLLTHEESVSYSKEYGHYLADETTAVVRFIFPIGKSRPLQTSNRSKIDYAGLFSSENEIEEADRNESNLVRWFFAKLFVQAIVETVDGEAQIWMVESGMNSRLYIWKNEN